jgi:hypothetical protein
VKNTEKEGKKEWDREKKRGESDQGDKERDKERQGRTNSKN